LCSHCRKQHGVAGGLQEVNWGRMGTDVILSTIKFFLKKGKLKLELPYDTAIPHLSEETQNANLKKYMHPYVHYSII
jgi:hypothetical protein